MKKLTDMTMFELASKSREQSGEDEPFRGILVCLDPGETTGFAMFNSGNLIACGQWHTKHIANSAIAFNVFLDDLEEDLEDLRIVVEDYKIYGWKSEDHSWSSLHTPKWIGAILAVAALRDIPVQMQMAHQAKQFCTDNKLKMWGMYATGQRHARDAIRHGCYYTLFNKTAQEDQHIAKAERAQKK